MILTKSILFIELIFLKYLSIKKPHTGHEYHLTAFSYVNYFSPDYMMDWFLEYHILNVSL